MRSVLMNGDKKERGAAFTVITLSCYEDKNESNIMSKKRNEGEWI